MQNENESKKKRFAGKGYYIALIACIAAVGISGYVFVKTVRSSAVETSAAVTISPEVSQEAESAVSEKSKTESKSGKTKDSKETAAEASAEPSDSRKADRMEDAYEATLAQGAGITWPLQGDVTATFSQDTLTYSQTMADWRTHEGLDIAASDGAAVCATQDGTVTAVYEDDFLGNVVVVSHSGDLATLYANLEAEPVVAVGDKVTAGQTLGNVGSSALLETAEASHLHFEVYENGAAVDPMEYLPD